MQVVTTIQLSTTMRTIRNLCNRHLLDLALSINQCGFTVLPSGQQKLVGTCDACQNFKTIAKWI